MNVLEKILVILFIISCQFLSAQVVLEADGPGGTYALITSILAPGQNPIEAPDCSHNAFGDHIDEVFDETLNDYVFRFHIHTAPDDDRCINFDRQRNEIKTYAPSPDNLLGTEEEIVQYKWKFKLEDGFQSSTNFTHLHQLKSVGGDLASMPMYTLTTRKGDPDRLELRYAETDMQITLAQEDLSPFIGKWLEVIETIQYGFSGTYVITIQDIESDNTLFTYSNDDIINWRPDAEFVRPKWGIYRSLINAQDLRDEQVFFADFSIEELEDVSNTTIEVDQFEILVQQLANQTIQLQNIPTNVEQIQLISTDGQIVKALKTKLATSMFIDVANLSTGIYVLHLSGKNIQQSQLIFLNQF